MPRAPLASAEARPDQRQAEERGRRFRDRDGLAVEEIVHRHDIEARTIDGAGALLITVPEMAPHAVKNPGPGEVQIISCSNGRFDPANPDTFRRTLLIED